MHAAVDAIEPSWRGELEITDAIKVLIEEGRDVRSTMITGYWKDTGNVPDMLEVNCTLLERLETRIEGDVDDASEIVGRVRIDAGATVRGSRIVGPATIGSGTVVENSYIGPSTSIAENCTVRNSEIEFSHRDERRVVRGHTPGGGLARRPPRRRLVRARVPATHRLVIGDHGKVQISS